MSQNAHGVGQTFVNFFGLGSQRTLTLVNGRRFVSSNSANGNRSGTGPGSQVDLNVIPTGLVERVETIAIGGAPVYGSDAIAGTVNIILKDDFEGLQTSAQYGITEEGDGESKTYRVLMGGNFDEGRGNAVVAVEYNEQDGLLYSDRLRLAQLRPNPLDTGDSDGIPGLRVIEDLRYGVLTEGGLPIDNSVPGLNLPGVTVPGLYPNGNWIFGGSPAGIKGADMAVVEIFGPHFEKLASIPLPQRNSESLDRDMHNCGGGFADIKGSLLVFTPNCDVALVVDLRTRRLVNAINGLARDPDFPGTLYTLYQERLLARYLVAVPGVVGLQSKLILSELEPGGKSTQIDVEGSDVQLSRAGVGINRWEPKIGATTAFDVYAVRGKP